MPTIFPGDERQDEKLNPGQQYADRTFSDLSQAEKAGTINPEGSTTPTGDEDIQQQEHDTSGVAGGWRNNTGQTTSDAPKKSRFKIWAKKASPALGIGGIIGVGGFIMIGLASPSLLIVQLKETMVDRFNTQLSSMEARTNKILYAKMNEATSGFCNATVSIRCKFTTMNEKQVKRLADAGITISEDSGKTVTGRTKPKTLIYKGTTIPANEFASFAAKNNEFRSALRQAYNPKYAGFAGKAWANVATRFKVSKTPPELNADTDEKKAREKINTIAKEGVEDTGSRTRVTASDADCKGSSCISEEDANKINADAEEIDKAAKDGSAASDVRSKLSGINTNAVSSFFKLSAPVDYACQAYGALTTLTYAAKAIRAAQLVRYAVLFIGVADAIKGGNAPEPEDVALLGGILTATVMSKDDSTKTLVGSGPDSFGYKYAAFGDSSASNRSMKISNRFMAGGGLVGELSTFSTSVLNTLGGRGQAVSTCGFLANPIVQGGSIILGIAAMFVPGANVAKIVASGAAAVTVSAGLAILPSLLADIVAGTVTDNILGEESANAITSGSGTLMADALAGQNGNAPMLKDDAIAYNSLQTETSGQYIADELRETSPFDPTNPHTFVGSIVATLLPLQSKSNPLTVLGSLLNTSISKVVPTSSALTTEEYAKTLDVCTDLDVVEAGYAADPFCNIIRGIPPQYLDKDPLKVIDELGAANLSEDGTPTGAYKNFIDKCILNEAPLGYSNLEVGYNNDEAKNCIISNENGNVNYYLHYIDQRVNLGMSDEDTAESAGEEPAQAGTGRPANTTDRGGNGGWTLTNNVDYSGTQCDPRTPDEGTFKSPQYGWTIRLCRITLNTGAGNSNGSSLVSSLISTNTMNMFEAAQAEGISLGLTDGMRKRPPSYFSMHSTGLAMDIGTPRGGQTICYGGSPTNGYGSLENAERNCKARGGAHYKAYTWLRANANKYGFFNFDKEPWHYSTSGNGV